jgi:urease accessory protein
MKRDDLAAAVPVHLDLAFEQAPGGATVLKRQLVAYPFHVGRVLHLPGDPAGLASVYLQCCSGGLFQGERLGLAVTAGEGAQVHLTTAASTVVHTMDAGHAEQVLRVEAGAGALVEYWPDPLILFPGSRLDTRLGIRAHAGATVIAAESFLAHDPRAGCGMFDWLRSETRIEDEDGRLLAVDRFRAEGRAIAEARPGVNGAFGLQGTVMVVHRADPAAALAALRGAIRDTPDAYAGASLLPGECGAWMRVLARDAIALRAIMRDAWVAARVLATGTTPGLRRK